MLDKLQQYIADLTGVGPDIQHRILASLLLILVTLLIRHLIIRIVWNRTENVRTRYIWRKVTTYLAIFLVALCLAAIWLPGMKSLTTFLGLFSAGLAIALRDIISNLAGWVFIIAKRPFTIGDRVQSGNHAGDVIDISAFHFTLLEIGNWVQADQSTGRVIQIPNSVVFTQALANYGKGFQYIWNEIPVLITFESNWPKAKEILRKIADSHALNVARAAEQKVKEASRYFMIFYANLTPTVYTDVRDSGVLLTIRHLCEPRRRRIVTESIWEDILREFSACDDIALAYPTRRYYTAPDSTAPKT